MDAPVSELFATVAEWATLKGARNLKDHPGLWEDELGDFKVAINGHPDEDHTTREGLTVPPFHAAINAPKYIMAVILVSPYGGMGSPGMEDDVISALKADIARLSEASA